MLDELLARVGRPFNGYREIDIRRLNALQERWCREFFFGRPDGPTVQPSSVFKCFVLRAGEDVWEPVGLTPVTGTPELDAAYALGGPHHIIPITDGTGEPPTFPPPPRLGSL